MSPAAIATIVFACVLGGALLGMAARPRIPESHLSADSREVIKLGMGLVATMAALVLGLVIATAKSSYDAQDEAIKHTAAKIVLLDRLLASYAPETQQTRELLRRTVEDRLESIWPRDGRKRARPVIAGAERTSHDIESRIMRMSPQDEAQRWLQSQAPRVGAEIAETRWLILGSQGNSVAVPFLVVIVSWLTIIFASFGLLAPRNATVMSTLLLCPLSVAGSIFLILEMDQPFEGLMRISSAPWEHALKLLGR